MGNEMTIYNAPPVEMKSYRNDYLVQIGDYNCKLVRDVDFGKVPKAKKPSLWKSGAEKVLFGFHLAYDTVITDSYKDFQNGIFYYEVMAKAYDSEGRVIRTGVGCCNTNEAGFGRASAFDSMNSALKKAKKRAVVDLALTIGCLSDAFTQDIEDDTNVEKAQQILGDNDGITSKQMARLFAIAGNNEITREKAKSLLAEWGYASTKDITQKDYEDICEKFANYGKTS